MSKSRKIDKKDIYDSIRKPIPKPGYAFKSKKQKLRGADSDTEFDDLPIDIDENLMRKLKNRKE